MGLSSPLPPLLIKTIADSWEALKTVSLFCLPPPPVEQTMESWLHHIGENGESAVDRLKTLREHDMNEAQVPFMI